MSAIWQPDDPESFESWIERQEPAYFVFDVESIGLYGEGYAVGFVVIDKLGEEIWNGRFACDPSLASGDSDDRKWCSDNIPAIKINCESPEIVRLKFWKEWMCWKEKGAVMACDCGWPVEARFLIACVDADVEGRKWNGPYPMHEIASIMVANGIDPMADHPRNQNELPKHDPLADARQSARLLIEAQAASALLAPSK